MRSAVRSGQPASSSRSSSWTLKELHPARRSEVSSATPSALKRAVRHAPTRSCSDAVDASSSVVEASPAERELKRSAPSPPRDVCPTAANEAPKTIGIVSPRTTFAGSEGSAPDLKAAKTATMRTLSTIARIAKGDAVRVAVATLQLLEQNAQLPRLQEALLQAALRDPRAHGMPPAGIEPAHAV